MFKGLEVLWRVVHLGAHLLAGWWVVRRHFARWDAAQRANKTMAWARRALTLLHIDLDVHGSPVQQGPAMLVANHVSWLDILVLLACCRCRFVAKSEVGRWPVIGDLTRGTGTLFVKRNSKRDAVHVVREMAQALRPEFSNILVIFPEGTTSTGKTVLPFHANLFQAAISANAPVQALAIRYEDALTRHQSLAPSYCGNDTLVGSIYRTLFAAPLRATLRFGQAQTAGDRTRRAWASDAHAKVASLLVTSQ